MIALMVFAGLCDGHQRQIHVEEAEMARAECLTKRGLPARIQDHETGTIYEIAWIDIGSSYRGHVILRVVHVGKSALT